MPNPALLEAREVIASLKVGDLVTITVDGRDILAVVQRREGHEVYRHPDGRSVTVGYGPGRWNTEVSASSIADGYTPLRKMGACPRCDGEGHYTLIGAHWCGQCYGTGIEGATMPAIEARAEALRSVTA